MSEQLSLYFDTLEELSEKDQEYMSRKYRHVLEKLDEIDALLNETSNGWKTKRMSRVDLTALRLAVYELLESVTVDGKFGAGTAAAVRRFQRYFGLTADGVVERTTWQKLYEVYNDIANRLLSSSLRPGDSRLASLRKTGLLK